MQLIKICLPACTAVALLFVQSLVGDGGGFCNAEEDDAPALRAILFTGGCCHDYEKQKTILTEGISRRANVTWTIVHEGGTGLDHQYEIFSREGWEEDFDIVVYNMCFANTKDEEYVQKILDVHAAGMPAIVIHCTMHTFRALESDIWREFLGATSTNHGRHAPIHVTMIERDHPVLDGLQPQWRTEEGELYRITRLWPTATSLAVGSNAENAADAGETCIWVNQYHEGRVFGTTLGHHNGTMEHDLYLDIVTRGLLWATDKIDDERYSEPAVSETDDAADDTPNLPVDQPASLEEPATLVAVEAHNRMLGLKAPEGFDVTLFAEPPHINYPTCVSAAPTGEVFIGVDENGSLGKESDRRQQIIRCIDTDGDGKADSYNVFADEVGSVRGLFYDNGSVWALHPPLLRVFHDDDGDGVADRNEVLVEGLASDALTGRGADHCTNGFRVGIDGWLYIAVGDFGCINATGSDGAEVQLLGGGVLRVRPDGSELELFAKGNRNIYDVAIDPYLNAFVRDNTNDGGGWDIRLSQIIPTGNYGYPSLFLNFADEIVQPIGIYGGGSGTGAVFVDEPGLPGGYGHALFTCDWGRNAVYAHGLSADGAGFEASQQPFVELPAPTDIDVDGQSRIFITSWKGGKFKFELAHVGYVACLTPQGAPTPAFPDLANVTDAQLVQHLASTSHVCRLHTQWEILRRDPSPELVRGIEQLAAGDAPLPARVAAIFTLKQMLGEGSHPALLRIIEKDDLREFALRALADRSPQNDAVPIESFLTSLTDTNARVRLAAVVGLGRLHRPEAAEAIIPLTADADPLVAHVAVHALVELQAADACLTALITASEAESLGIVRALSQMHNPAVVDGIIACVDRASTAQRRRLLFVALCRLYHQEGEWNGNWWGTRPDTTGPYFRPTPWDESEKIEQVLRIFLANVPNEESAQLSPELIRHRIALEGVDSRLFEIALDDRSLWSTALSLLIHQGLPPVESLPFLKTVALDDSSHPLLRSQALTLLQSNPEFRGAREAVVSSLASIDQFEENSEVLLSARNRFIFDSRHATDIDFFLEQLDSDGASRRILAWSVLLVVLSNDELEESARDAIERRIETGWTTAYEASDLCIAIGRTYSRQFENSLAAAREHEEEKVRRVADQAVERLLAVGNADTSSRIVDLELEAIVEQVGENVGDIFYGRTLYFRQGCVKCHTVAGGESVRGPHLADIGTRYSRRELAESIVRPSAKIAQGFQTQWFLTDQGLTHEGFVVRETGATIELRDQTGSTIVVEREAIDEQGYREVSIMPTGQVDQLTPRDLLSLLAYLESLRSTP